MSWVDIAIVVIIVISAVISLFRGLIKEVLSLVAWIVAFLVAFRFTDNVSPLLSGYVSLPSARQIIAFLALFVLTLIAGAIINYMAGRLVAATGLTGTDRALGMIFGALRGWAIVVVLTLLAGATALPQDPWWRRSSLLGHFQEMALLCRDLLPAKVAGYFSFEASQGSSTGSEN